MQIAKQGLPFGNMALCKGGAGAACLSACNCFGLRGFRFFARTGAGKDQGAENDRSIQMMIAHRSEL